MAARNKRHDSTTRRDFLKQSALVGTAFWVGGATRTSGAESPNEKLNIAVVGPGGRGAANLSGVAGENIVALCEVDQSRSRQAFERFPKAARYEDFRKLLDKEESNLDAVVISTPDHLHVPIAVDAMRRGLHVYCEKPLSHSVHESRVAAEVAKEQRVATQLGTQIHAGSNYRRVVEIIRAGTIGPVEEVHVWVGKGWGGGDRPTATPEVPADLAWDLWLGPAPQRPYHPTYLPANWRRWWDFGNGTLGDMGCHYMDLPFWALDLEYPETVEAEGPDVHPETAPLGMVVRYEFPPRGAQPAVRLTWYDGNRTPKMLHGHKLPGSGVLFVGKKGMLQAGYSNYRLLPGGEFADFKLPEPTIPNSIGHHREWLNACRDGTATTCHFGYSGPLSETVLLGTVAFRVGKKLEWDARKLEAKNAPEAAEFIRREYRAGWTL